MPGADRNPMWGPDWPQVRELWPLETTVAHLNHGSFGAVPTVVLEEQASWRSRMEINPVRFFTRELGPALDLARAEGAAFLGAEDGAAAFVPNATTAVSTVLASVELGAGDAVLLTDHGFGAVQIAAKRWSHRAGARVDVAGVPLQAAEDEVVHAILDAVTPHTRLAVVDQITSSSARTFPVQRLVGALQERGVAVLVDGAHVPGMVETDIEALGADFWVGNFHKWAFAPRGTAMLVVAKAHRARLLPLVASWREDEGFPGAYEDTGTTDLTAWLSLPRALRFLEHLDAARLRQHNLDVVNAGQRMIAAAMGLDDSSLPRDPVVSMRLVPLPDGVVTDAPSATALQARIGQRAGVEVAVTTLAGDGFVRVSGQAYNCPSDYERLADALPSLLESDQPRAERPDPASS